MIRNVLLRFFTSILAVGFAVHANAAPVLGLDMDPGTPGIQSTLSVPEGSPLTVNLVAFDDGTPVTPILVDAVAVEMTLAGTGGVGFGGATVGPFGLAMGAIDAVDFIPVGIDPTLAGLPTPTPGSLGLFSYFGAPTLLSISTLATALVADSFDVVMSFSFSAVTAGTVSMFTPGSPPGSELLFAGAGGPLFPAMMPPATLTITSSAPPPPPPGIPEPGTLFLSLIALAGVMKSRHGR